MKRIGMAAHSRRRPNMRLIAPLLALTIAVGTALAQQEATGDAMFTDLIDGLGTVQDTSMFAEAFEAYSVHEQMDPSATYTAFVPTDSTLETAEFEFRSADDVMAHIVPERYTKSTLAETARDAAEGEPAVLQSLAGTEIELRPAQEGEVALNGDTYIMQEDTEAGRVMVHTVAGILIEGVGASGDDVPGADVPLEGAPGGEPALGEDDPNGEDAPAGDATNGGGEDGGSDAAN